jgi:hypothetical protein
MSTAEPTLPPVVMVRAKPWWQSSTVWLNAVGIVVAMLTGFLELDFIREIPSIQSWNVGILGVLNVVLRVFRTVAPVTVLGQLVAPLKD